MAKIAIFNQKGGVGKTTTSLNLSAALTRRGQAPLAIDMDPQGHLSAITGHGRQCRGQHLRLLPLRESVDRPDPRRAWWLAGHSSPCGAVQDRLPGEGTAGTQPTQRGHREGETQHRPADPHRLLPVLGVLSLNAIFACDRILVPVSADWLAVKGVLQVEKTLKALEHVFKKRLPRRFVVTRFDSRRRMSHDIFREIQERYGDELCRTRISENVSVAESPASNEDVFTHAPGSRGAQDYDALLDELVETGFLP